MSEPTQHRLFIIVLVIALLGNGWLIFERFQLQQEVAMLQEDRNIFLLNLRETSAQLAAATSTITDLQNTLETVREDLEELEDDYRDEKNRNEDFEDQIRAISGTVGDLNKLSQIDEELLMKYSRVSFLNENYIPSRLEPIDEDYTRPDVDQQYFHAEAMEFLEDLMEAAERANIELQIVSAYRSFDEQNFIKGQFTQTYGEGANAFSADQGFSEHQLGTTVDFTTPEIGTLTTAFADTEAYEWLQENAHRYGFVLSYPEGNQFYIFEPWHWRFVGEDLARDLNREDAHFYDWEQRKIDEYLITLFD